MSRGLQVLLGKRTSTGQLHGRMSGSSPAGPSIVAAPQRRQATSDYREPPRCVSSRRRPPIRIEDPDELVPFSRWITPVEVKIRYDTRFYLALAPAHSSPTPDGDEIVELAWFTPADALERHAEGEMQLVFPTIKQLEGLRRARFRERGDCPAARGTRDRARSCRRSSSSTASRASCCRATRATTLPRDDA